MMQECNIDQLLTRDAFMHHDDKVHDALKHYPALKGLKTSSWQVREDSLLSGAKIKVLCGHGPRMSVQKRLHNHLPTLQALS